MSGRHKKSEGSGKKKGTAKREKAVPKKKRAIVRAGQNPSRFRQFVLWFKPSWRMTFEEYVDHYHRLKPEARELLRQMSAEEKKAKQRFVYMVKHYRHIYGPEDNIIDHRALVEGLHALGLPKNASVVSYGAGNMHHECFLVKEFPQIAQMTGVEPLALMRKRAKLVAINVLGLKKRKKVKNIDGTFSDSPGIATRSADAIVSNEAFHHVKDPLSALMNMASKLKENGGIVIVYRPNYKTNPPKPAEFKPMLELNGLEVVLSKTVREDKAEPNNNIHLIVARKKAVKE